METVTIFNTWNIRAYAMSNKPAVCVLFLIQSLWQTSLSIYVKMTGMIITSRESEEYKQKRYHKSLHILLYTTHT